MILEFDGLQTKLMDLEANLTQTEVKPLVRRKREVKHEIKKLEKLMKTISSLRSALQLMISEAPGFQIVVLILGGSPLRPQKAYELLFTHSDYVVGYEGDFAKSKAAEALSKKTIRALISTGAGSTSYPGPMRLFILFYAPASLNLPHHFLPKRDFRYNRKFVPLKLRFKCRIQDNATNSPLNPSTNALLSLITSYRLSRPDSPIKLVYCTRTVHEMEKTLAELKLLHDYQVRR